MPELLQKLDVAQQAATASSVKEVLERAASNPEASTPMPQVLVRIQFLRVVQHMFYMRLGCDPLWSQLLKVTMVMESFSL